MVARTGPSRGLPLYVVFSDKLVPTDVFAIIPAHAEVRFASKFVEDYIQASLPSPPSKYLPPFITQLEQGDAIAFRPIRSAYCCRDPFIQRVVAEGVIVCTGVGRQGKEVKLAAYERARTVLILIGVAWIAQVITAMIRDTKVELYTERRTGEHKAGNCAERLT
ncbi:hypothetical protein K503DRAFT_806002 [Rhizopogon vinicolor AM-OR11-026]|uniref:Uncharacterized protein n=1 Tax=Rhizopogon vinicolor AM-OR11-026 TaxID=1314800 RepID=A0A1B7MFZ4_9AGAM|nr:hypothetical protein K503DRAFT_806002 [Rhizopogon vinicolor AM-OR11-026]